MKVRLFLSPPATTPSLYEVDLPEGDEPAAGVLRCFSPPPGDRGGPPDAKAKAWKVDLDEGRMAELTILAREISLFPMGGPMPSERAATVELSLTSGQAEARLRWWMSPPREWTEVDRFVARLQELAGSGR